MCFTSSTHRRRKTNVSHGERFLCARQEVQNISFFSLVLQRSLKPLEEQSIRLLYGRVKNDVKSDRPKRVSYRYGEGAMLDVRSLIVW